MVAVTASVKEIVQFEPSMEVLKENTLLPENGDCRNFPVQVPEEMVTFAPELSFAMMVCSKSAP